MSEWKKVKLVDICDIRSGKRLPKGTDFSTVPTNYKYIRARDIKNGIINGENLAYITKDVKDKISKYIVNANDIAITIVGASVGDVAYVSPEFDGINLTENAVRLTNFKDNTNPRFIFYILNSPEYYLLMQQIAGGAAQPKMGIYKVEAIEVCIPSIFDQNRIVDILSRYDSLVENYQKQIKLLEEAAQRLYKEWFVDFRFPGHEHTKIIDGVPEGWEKKKFEDIFSYVRGKSYTSKELSDSGTILVNLKNIQAFGGYKRDAEKRYLGDYKQEQSLEVGDLIMGVTDMTQERRIVGHVALTPEFKESATFSMDLIKILPFELSKSFLYCAMRFGGISKQIAPLANGVNVLHLKPEAMMGIEMVVPSKELIEHFDDYYNHGFNTILHLQDQIHLLTEARDRLLPKLMSGEILV